MPNTRHVLPTNVRPTHYHLALVPDLDNAVFSADVTIDVVLVEPTAAITLNAVGLDFSQVTVHVCGTSAKSADTCCATADAFSAASTSAVESDVTVLSLLESAEDQRITLRLSHTLAAASTAQLRFSYSAKISETLFGFYRSCYSSNGVKRYIGATQLCPAEARRVFPCWDEPAVKATFALDITAPADMQVWSNTLPTSTTTLPSGRVRWAFRVPYVMSTYLLAWVVGDMEVVESMVAHTAAPAAPGTSADATSTTADGKATPSFQLRAVVARGKGEQAEFALMIASKVLSLYEEYFQCRYVFPKMDLIALPNFAFGAMENWGCVTFREQTLLVAADGSKGQRERVATVVAHELAHQWFGNLATMAWWSDLWLNESFATYMATWAVNKIFPEWAVDAQFVFCEGSRAYQLDALRSSHPIEVAVRDVREVDGIFDAISYSKGAMILRMTAKFIGEEGLQRGLMDYLARYAFSAATSEQLWECLSGPAAPNLRTVLQSWTQLQGYPYVQATHDSASHQLTLKQSRFLVMCDVTPEENAGLWQIPLYYTYGTAAGEVKTMPLVMAARSVTVNVPEATWVKVNTEQIAFCRVQYSADMLQRLVEAVRLKAIGGTDRYALIADLAAFARGGYCSTTQALALLAHYHDEDHCVVWCEVVDFEKNLRCILGDASAEVKAAFDAFCQRLYRPTIQRLLSEDAVSAGYRAEQICCMLFERLLVSRDPDTMAVAREKYEHRATAPIPSSMIEAIYGAHVQEGGAAALAELKKLIAETDYAEVRTHYLGALAAVPGGDAVVTDVFDFILSDAVQSQDVATVLLSLARRADTQRGFARALMAQWPRLTQKLPSVVLTRVVKMVEHGCDAAVATELRDFFAGQPEEMQSRLRMTFQQGIEGLLCNAAWARRDAQGIAEYLLQAKWTL